MKGLKVNMDMVNCGLLLVVLVLVVMCCVKREGYQDKIGEQRGPGGTGGIKGVMGNRHDGASGYGLHSRRGGHIAKGVQRRQY